MRFNPTTRQKALAYALRDQECHIDQELRNVREYIEKRNPENVDKVNLQSIQSIKKFELHNKYASVDQ